MSHHFSARVILVGMLLLTSKSVICQGGRSYLFDEPVYVDFPTPRPHDFDNSNLLAKNGIHTENIFMYVKNGKKTDSQMVVTKYFDSAGLCIEKDEFDSSNLLTITDNTYFASNLTMQHITVKSNFYNDIIITYSYNDEGNKTDEKVFSKSVFDSTSNYELRAETQWTYDSLNHLSAEYFSNTGKFYIRTKYYYENDTLRLVENFDEHAKKKSSEYYEYDAQLHIKRMYGKNDKKDLEREYYYDTSGNLIKEIQYDVPNDVNTLSFDYVGAILNDEKFHSKYADDVFFKCYYLKDIE